MLVVHYVTVTVASVPFGPLLQYWYVELNEQHEEQVNYDEVELAVKQNPGSQTEQLN